MEREIVTRRTTYEAGSLDAGDVASDPFDQFKIWLGEALRSPTIEPNAMTLATVAEDGRPSARIVLLRGFDERGFVFYTNYDSRKGRELSTHQSAALLFFWAALERQVRIEGDVTLVSPEESDAYFATRPRGHRISAWASPQSTVARSRAELESEMARYEGEFEGRDVPRPPYWGGYRVRPLRYEFWQGRPNRVHDRIAYELADDAWRIVRLAP